MPKTDADRPDASNVNYETGQTGPNNVVATLANNGEVCIYSSQETHLLVDLNGDAQAEAVVGAPEAFVASETRAGGGHGHEHSTQYFCSCCGCCCWYYVSLMSYKFLKSMNPKGIHFA